MAKQEFILVNVGSETKRKAQLLKDAYGFTSVRELIISLIQEKWNKQQEEKK